ncbi:MAG TPA: putative Ig domain-containing protein [Edaphobacter sp.]|jgi:hypothetical protein|nr:putative Ig domain-containing protein [Edaphobacter sp.]
MLCTIELFLPRYKTIFRTLQLSSVTLLLFVATLVGCGGSSNSTGGGGGNTTPPPSALVYPQTTINATTGQAITPDTPSLTGTAASFAVSPTLPAGLSLSTTTGTISGTPTAVSAQTTYNITATNSAGSTTATVQITVAAPVVAPSNLVYPQTSISATTTVAITTDTPTVTGTAPTFTIAPALPAGLAISSTTGAISGTPTAVSTQTNYTVTATNSAGSTTATITITVVAAPAPPTSLAYPQPSIVGMVGQSLPANIPVLTGGISAFTISPQLPAGLTMNFIGTISGTPTAASPPTTYTVAAANISGSTSATITIAVNKALPTLLDLGHVAQISAMKVSSTRLLSVDVNNHWVLWDTTANTELQSSDVITPSASSCCSSTLPWPIDMAGQIFVIGLTNGLEVHDVTDGHAIFILQSSVIDPQTPNTKSWWKLASDGSYVCSGSQAGLAIWDPTGRPVFIRAGDYSAAKAFAAPGQILVANGPAGANVIETVSATNGTSTTGPAFTGTFNTWFFDGQRFLTNTGNTVSTYSNASALLGSASLPSVENLAGNGSWFYIYGSGSSTTPLTIYPVGGSAPSATLTFPSGSSPTVIPSTSTLGLIPGITGAISIVDLSGSTPVKTDFASPVPSLSAFAATSAAKWIAGNGEGVVLDGSGLPATPRYFGYGKALSIAGSTGYIAVATAIGQIPYYVPTSTTPVNTISGRSTKLALSSTGSVLAAIQGSALRTYAIPSGTVTQVLSPPTNFSLINFTLSSDASTVGELFQSNITNTSFIRQVAPASGGAAIWSDNPPDAGNLPQLSFDGSIATISTGPPTSTSSTAVLTAGNLTATVAGQAIAWTDSAHFLTQPYSAPGTYTGTSNIFNQSGTLTSTVAIPKLSTLLPVSSTSIYAPDLNTIFSLSTGGVLYNSLLPAAGTGAIAGPQVVFATGSRIVTDTY